MSTVKKPSQDVSPEVMAKIEELKKTHKSVILITTPEGDKNAYLKKPDRKIVSMVKSLGGTDEVAITELLLDACWLEGDEEIRTDDDYFLAIMPQVNDILFIKEVELKKF